MGCHCQRNPVMTHADLCAIKRACRPGGLKSHAMMLLSEIRLTRQDQSAINRRDQPPLTCATLCPSICCTR